MKGQIDQMGKSGKGKFNTKDCISWKRNIKHLKTDTCKIDISGRLINSNFHKKSLQTASLPPLSVGNIDTRRMVLKRHRSADINPFGSFYAFK